MLLTFFIGVHKKITKKNNSTVAEIIGILLNGSRNELFSPIIRRTFMKQRFIAVLVSLFVVTLSVQADVSSKKQVVIKQPVVVNTKIDLNKADVDRLTGSFKGIGKKRAQAIIVYRDTHQGFKSLEEFAEVKGFGSHFLDANRDKLKEVFVIN